MDKKRLIFFILLLVAFLLRFNNIHWDDNLHLHPDERFLTMVGNAQTLPRNIFDYFNQQVSPLNPANAGYKFFVYGSLPSTLNKIFAMLLGNDSYNAFTLQGRAFSAFFDMLVVVMVYKMLELFEVLFGFSKRIKFFGAFLYAIAPLPIQLSHFYAVDTFLNFFVFASLYCALKFYVRGNVLHVVLSAVFFSFALASKASAVFMLPLILLVIGLKEKNILLIFGIIGYIALRFADPYLFQNPSLFDPRISEAFYANIKLLKSWEGKDVWFPPAIQWIGKRPVFFSLQNIAFFGIGIPYFIAVVLGICRILQQKKKYILKAILLWCALFFFYQSTQFSQAMRYFLFLYPFFAIFGAIGLSFLFSRFRFFIFYILYFILLLIWPLSFSSIYMQKHSRIAASAWMYQHIPSESVILGEYWDDPLPFSVPQMFGKQFYVELLPVFEGDTDDKWERMNAMLAKADYYVLSSNRGWGSIMPLPEKYPLMSRFYKDLLDNKTQYKKIKEFTSYPRLCIPFTSRCVMFDDSSADESFTVYDHPKVMIFENTYTSSNIQKRNTPNGL